MLWLRYHTAREYSTLPYLLRIFQNYGKNWRWKKYDIRYTEVLWPRFTLIVPERNEEQHKNIILAIAFTSILNYPYPYTVSFKRRTINLYSGTILYRYCTASADTASWSAVRTESLGGGGDFHGLSLKQSALLSSSGTSLHCCSNWKPPQTTYVYMYVTTAQTAYNLFPRESLFIQWESYCVEHAYITLSHWRNLQTPL